MKAGAIEKFIMHLHPKKVSTESIKFTRTFGLGGINALLFVILAFTGILLRFSYVPTVGGAYDSIIYLQEEVLFGQWLRNIHHYAAHLMVITSFLHLVRVYYSHSFYRKRSKNWIYGMILFVMVLFFNFTGYLLPWDQLAFWAVTVMTQVLDYVPFVGPYLADALRGGDTINGHTLLNFYNLHTSVLPIAIIVFMSLHFWLVRAAGGVATPTKVERHMVDCRQTLVPREALVAVIVIAGLLLVSALFNAPLEGQANPGVSPNPNKAPWYFLGAQELLLHLSPIFSAFIVPMLVSVLFFILPYFKYDKINTGVWYHSPRGKVLVLESSIFAFVFTFLLILLLDLVVRPSAAITALPNWLGGGVLPMLLYFLPFVGFIFYQNRKEKLEVAELIQIVVTVILTSYIVMMLTSQFLRGEGMKLFA